MFKQVILALGALVATIAFAAVDVNKASQAELEAIKGIGPTVSASILASARGAVQDWNDFATRQGRRRASASKFSQNGLTVNGATYAGAALGSAGKPRRRAAADRKKADPAAVPAKK